VPGIDQPIPDHERDLFLQDCALGGGGANRLQDVEFILPGASQQGTHEVVLALEYEEQDTRRGPDGLRERTQGEITQPMFQHVLVGCFQQVFTPLRHHAPVD
jgi:hypothetical protein